MYQLLLNLSYFSAKYWKSQIYGASSEKHKHSLHGGKDVQFYGNTLQLFDVVS